MCASASYLSLSFFFLLLCVTHSVRSALKTLVDLIKATQKVSALLTVCVILSLESRHMEIV